MLRERRKLGSLKRKQRKRQCHEQWRHQWRLDELKSPRIEEALRYRRFKEERYLVLITSLELGPVSLKRLGGK
jgi:hypothetical protein